MGDLKDVRNRMTALAKRCIGLSKSTGQQCKRNAIPGGTVCRMHGGAAPQVKAKAAIRAEVWNWGLNDVADDPGEVLLKLVTQSRRRADMYAIELEGLVEREGFAEAVAGDIEIPTKYGSYKAGEYPRVLAKLEAEERDRCANFAAKAVAAGLAERQVRLAERQGEMLAVMVAAALKEAGISPEQTQIVNAALGRQARELTA